MAAPDESLTAPAPTAPAPAEAVSPPPPPTGVVGQAAAAVAQTATSTAQAVATATQAAANAVTSAAQQAPAPVQQAAHSVNAATHQAQAAVQQAAQRATVSPRSAIYRGRRFAVGYALAVLALAFLGALARRHKVLPGDVGITRLIQRGDSGSYALLMSLVSELGWQWPSVIMRLTATGLTWAAGFRMESAFIAATWSGDVVTMAIKETVGRPRPTRDLVRVTYTLGEHSFPSGHVVHYVTFYGFLFYMTWIYLKQGLWRNVVLTLLAGVVLLIGPSRVYQGAHWPSDVSGAYLVGSLWLAVQIVAYIEIKARYQFQPRWPFFRRRTRQL